MFILMIWLLLPSAWASVACPEICSCPQETTEEESFHGTIFQCQFNGTMVNVSHQNEPWIFLTLYNKVAVQKDFLKHFPWINRLIVKGLGLKEIPEDAFDGIDNLDSVEFTDNELTDLPENLFNLNPNIWFITLEGNRLTQWSSKYLPKSETLMRLFLGRNLLQNLTDETFENFNALEWLFLQQNGIQTLPKTMLENKDNLVRLDLSENEIVEIPEFFFQNSRYLKNLNLSHNQLAELHSSFSAGFLALQILDLSFNKIQFISESVFAKLYRLLYLNLSSNRLKSIDYESLRSLQRLTHLDLSFNRLDLNNPFFVPSKNLLSLNLSYNDIQEIPFSSWENLTLLVDLDLRSNHIGFLNIQDLKFLYLSEKDKFQRHAHNSLKSRNIYFGAIHLQGNRIAYVDLQFEKVIENITNSDILHLQHPAFIYIDENPLRCDCESIPLQTQLLSNEEEVLPFKFIANNLKCSVPTILHGQFLKTVPKKDLQCEPQSNVCPYECECFHFSEEIFIDCSGTNLTEIPFVKNSFNVSRLDMGFTRVSNLLGLTESGWLNLKKLHLEGSLKNSNDSIMETKPFSKLQNLLHLDLSRNNFQLLPDGIFEELQELVHLDLSFNDLATVSSSLLKYLQKLEILHLEYNNIKSFDDKPFSMLTNLKQLYLSHNFFETIPEAITKANIHLEILDFQFNRLQFINDSINLPTLDELNLNNNELRKISIDWPPSLRHILLENNAITQIQDLGTLSKNLRLLNLNNNKLENLNISQLTSFNDDADIILTNNEIKYIHVPNGDSFNVTVIAITTFLVNSNPIHCDCNLKPYMNQRIKPSSQTGVQFADDELFCKTPLFFKDISVDDLRVDQLICESNDDCPSECECYRPTNKETHQLDCTQRRNDSLPKHIPANVTKAFFNNLKVSSLSALSDNQWQNVTDLDIQTLSGNADNFNINIFQSLHSLYRLSIKFCADKYEVDSLAGLKNLERLQINKCKIQTLTADTFNGTTRLTHISLSENDITKVPANTFQQMQNLDTLDLSHNRIATLHPDFLLGCPNLRVLNLAVNYLISLKSSIFIACRKLIDLNLSRNNLGYRDVRDLELDDTSLERLNFSRNSIEDISYKWMKISSLKDLDLSFNKLEAISLTMLSEFPCGAKIYVQNNKIDQIPKQNISNHCKNNEKIILNVNYNPVTCDCKIFAFQQLIRNQDSIMFNTSDLYCAEPPQLMNKMLFAINEKDLICKYDDACSQNCSCYSRADSNIIQCSGRNLERLPSIHNFIPSVLMLDDNKGISIEGINSPQWSKLIKFSLKNSECRECKDQHRLAESLQNLTELTVLELAGNNISGIMLVNFAQFSKLNILDLSNNNIRQIPNNMLHGNKQIKSLDLSKNIISNIPEKMFHSLSRLEHLSLSRNNIRELPENLLDDQRNLQYLNLSFNQLVTLPYGIFDQMVQLKTLDLSHNRIYITSKNIFQIPSFVTHLNFSNNEISFILEKLWKDSPSPRNRLENLDLSNNFIKIFSLQDLLLGNNTFCDVNLDGNLINKLNLTLSNEKTNSSQSWYNWLTVSLNNNPVICDCEIAKFRNQNYMTVEGSFKSSISITIPENVCTLGPDVNVGKPSDSQPFCYNFDHCPKNCSCLTLLKTNETLLNCSSSGLRHLPKTESFSFNMLVADHNAITDITDVTTKRWMNLSYADFSFNKISSLPNSTFRKKIAFISLKGNLLEKPSGWLDYYVTQSIKLSFQMNLANNPWLCDCGTLPFQNWLLNNEKKVKDILQVKCLDGDEVLLNIDVCFKKIITILATTFTLIAILLIILITLYFLNKNAVHVWLYAHNICTCFIKEELIDQDKEFDAFISYSSEDREFVFNDLIPALEDEKPYFHVCIHERDWKAGEGIIDQIAHSIEMSRRVIFVVSEHFVESSWSCFEFKTAHHKCVIEKINRIIIIMFGDLPPRDKIEPDLRMHISMNTYLQWGDPKFFDKLRYAMPKKKPERRREEREDEGFGDVRLELQEIINN